MSLTPDQIKDQILTFKKGAVDFITEKELAAKLEKKSKLRVKAGFDPSRPDLHLGHAIILNKLREFQKLGHEVIFLLGDFTASIGDPTGQNEMRPLLSPEEIKENAKTYEQQVFKILDPKSTIVEKNSNWMGKMKASDFITLSSKYTVARILERDDFQKRYKENKPISIHEFIYPLVQGYDSVALHSDIELGGTDQRFNLLVGRELQKTYSQSAQCILTLPLLEGLDGVKKMSKSLGNHIGLLENPRDMFGKTMKVSDELMWRYYELLTELSVQEISKMKEEVAAGRIHPRKVKVDLAKKIVTDYHSLEAANQAESEFDTIFVNKGLPDKIKEFDISDLEDLSFRNILVISNVCGSRSDVGRLIKEGALHFFPNGNIDKKTKVTKVDEVIDFSSSLEVVIQLGRKKFLKVVKKG